MLWDWGYHDIDDTIWIHSSYLCLSIYRLDLPLLNQRVRYLQDSKLQGFEISYPTLFRTKIPHSWWIIDTFPMQSMVLITLESRLQTFQPSIFLSPWSMWISVVCPRNLMFKDYFGTLPEVQGSVSCLSYIRWFWITSGLLGSIVSVLHWNSTTNLSGARNLLTSVHL